MIRPTIAALAANPTGPCDAAHINHTYDLDSRPEHCCCGHPTHDERLMLIPLKWLGTALTLAGALATSLGLDPMNIWLLNLGSVTWLAASVIMKDLPLISINAGLLTIYAVGAIIRLS